MTTRASTAQSARRSGPSHTVPPAMNSRRYNLVPTNDNSGIEISQYAAYKIAKNVEPLGLYIDAPLSHLVKRAASVQGMKRDPFVRMVLAAAVNATFPDVHYVLPTTPNLKEEVAKKDAEIAALRAQLAAQAPVTPPTPPAVQADPKTGKTVEKEGTPA